QSVGQAADDSNILDLSFYTEDHAEYDRTLSVIYSRGLGIFCFLSIQDRRAEIRRHWERCRVGVLLYRIIGYSRRRWHAERIYSRYCAGCLKLFVQITGRG